MAITATVRMYHVGELGDCFLLKFDNGQAISHVLIDCGSFRNKSTSVTRLNQIVKHIKKDLKGAPLDVVVGTHQHNDHVSGFVHAEAQFQGMVDQVWLSWLDDPSDNYASRIYNEQKNLLGQVKQIYGAAEKAGLAGELKTTKDMLGFYSVAEEGGDPEIPAKGIEILKRLGKKPVRYLLPGDQPSLPRFKKSEVKVYVLGPPRSRDFLFDKDPKKGESYDHALALANANAEKILSAVGNHLSGMDQREEDQFPFNQRYKKKESAIDEKFLSIYRQRNNAWRQIDEDWLSEIDSLSLYLDSFTNNSSLVLAFELVESKKVLLFVGDAQTGNWLSWDNIHWENVKQGFSASSLLANTVLYKVGHHGSHNATLVAALEAMTHKELVAMIPVDKNDPNIKPPPPKAPAKNKSGKAKKPRKWKMPARNLYKRLKEKTGNRILRMDEGFADGCAPGDTKATWGALSHMPHVDENRLFVEYTING